MLEKSIESRCVRFVNACDGRLVKLQGAAGWPDRLLVLPGCRTAFVEFKQPGEEPSDEQGYVLDTLRGWGHVAEWVTDFYSFMWVLYWAKFKGVPDVGTQVLRRPEGAESAGVDERAWARKIWRDFKVASNPRSGRRIDRAAPARRDKARERVKHG